jgi:hypothetical protein
MAGAGRHIFGSNPQEDTVFRVPIGSYANLVAADSGWLAARTGPSLTPTDSADASTWVITTRLPYRLGFDIRVRHLQHLPPWRPSPPGNWTASAAGHSPQSTAGRWSATTGMCGPPVWACLLLVLLALIVACWRRRT